MNFILFDETFKVFLFSNTVRLVDLLNSVDIRTSPYYHKGKVLHSYLMRPKKELKLLTKVFLTFIVQLKKS